MRSAAIVALAAAACGLAQEVGNYTSSLNMTINPGTVESATRNAWCQAQYNTCRTLCDDNTNQNNCESSNLTWECTCASNNSMPGLEYYTQTMPFFVCKELDAQCRASTDDSRIQEECKSNINDKCPKYTPPKDPASDDQSSSTTAEATTSTTTGGASAATNSQISTTNTKDLAAPTLMPGNGVAAVAAIGLLAYML